jgi:predicted DNA-binding transcriptional regulator YafY
MKDYLDEYIVATRLIYRAQGASVYELAEALGKTTRAVYMLLNQLETMNFPIWTDPDPDNPKMVRYHAASTFMEKLPSMDFTDEDKAVFNYLMDSANNTPGMEVQARHLFTKLKLMASERGALMENNVRKPLAIASSASVVKKIDNKKAAKIISALLEALSEKQWITLEYQNIWEESSYSFTVYPIVLFVDQGDYYLYAFNKKEQIRMLTIERINEVLSTLELPAPTTQVDVKALINDPFGIVYDTNPFCVELHIDEEQALYIKQKKWPEGVTITDNKDGSITFCATTHSYYNCKTWILARTPHVTVLSPSWLIDDIRESLQAGLSLYTTP